MKCLPVSLDFVVLYYPKHIDTLITYLNIKYEPV